MRPYILGAFVFVITVVCLFALEMFKARGGHATGIGPMHAIYVPLFLELAVLYLISGACVLFAGR